jgi:tryptophan synthase alpha chain
MSADPDIATTKRLVLEFEKSGVDIVELGVPFSDPLADGPTIQKAAMRALENKVNLRTVFDLVSSLRRRTQIPIVILCYYNLILKFGESRFARCAKSSGIDGVAIPDLPPEEATSFIKAGRKENLDTIFFLSPTSPLERIKLVCRLSRGFIYYVSLTGVTGARDKLPADILKNISLIKRFSEQPICVGFGVSRARQVRRLARAADGVIVGSAIIKKIEKNLGSPDLIDKVLGLVRELSGPLSKCIKR